MVCKRFANGLQAAGISGALPRDRMPAQAREPARRRGGMGAPLPLGPRIERLAQRARARQFAQPRVRHGGIVQCPEVVLQRSQTLGVASGGAGWQRNGEEIQRVAQPLGEDAHAMLRFPRQAGEPARRSEQARVPPLQERARERLQGHPAIARLRLAPGEQRQHRAGQARRRERSARRVAFARAAPPRLSAQARACRRKARIEGSLDLGQHLVDDHVPVARGAERARHPAQIARQALWHCDVPTQQPQRRANASQRHARLMNEFRIVVRQRAMRIGEQHLDGAAERALQRRFRVVVGAQSRNEALRLRLHRLRRSARGEPLSAARLGIGQRQQRERTTRARARDAPRQRGQRRGGARLQLKFQLADRLAARTGAYFAHIERHFDARFRMRNRPRLARKARPEQLDEPRARTLGQ